MSGLMLHIHLPPWSWVPWGDPAMVITSVLTPLWEEPRQKPIPLCQTSLWLLAGWNQTLHITRPNGKPHRLGLSLPPSWWPELQSIDPGQLCDAQVQELAKKQAVGFRLPAAQDSKVGWWNAPPCVSSLRWWCKFKGTRDIWEVRKEQTVGLAQALKYCAEWSGAAPDTMCGKVWDLQRCLAPLIQLDEEDIWEASLLESVQDEPMASLTPTEEALLLGEDLEPPESWGICPTYSHLAESLLSLMMQSD